MFKLAENTEIGRYLETKIIYKYVNVRRFCKAYLEFEKRTVNDDEIRKMQNKMSQIIKGKKSVQLYDLPVFYSLLGITCEEVLSAGKFHLKSSSYVTNRSIALSKNKKEWVDFINRDDKLILNQDEYNKTVIDYAIEFKNYKLLKFLVDNKYIWFDCGDKKQYGLTFGAGTNIKRRNPINIDCALQVQLCEKDDLRKNIIALAIENNDFDVLDDMRARELPCMYFFNSINKNEIEPSDYNEEMIKSIANSSNDIVDYFTDEFEIKDFLGKNPPNHTYVFPFYSELLKLLVKNNHDYTEIAIKKAIEHNEKIYEKLSIMINDLTDNILSFYKNYKNENDNEYFKTHLMPKIIDNVLNGLYFSKNGNVLSFYGYNANYVSSLVANFVCCKAKSKNVKIQYLIDELNKSFDKIVNIKSEFLEEV